MIPLIHDICDVYQIKDLKTAVLVSHRTSRRAAGVITGRKPGGGGWDWEAYVSIVFFFGVGVVGSERQAGAGASSGRPSGRRLRNSVSRSF